MPRRARLSVPGIPWHIIQRGNNRSACFYADADYRRYLAILKEQATKHGCLVHAYVLMTNHVHLLVTPEHEHSASLLMKNLGQQYVQHVNRRYQRTGTLWEGRFRSCLIESQAYLLACYRYVELNPVRANMVEHPRQYPWSSFRVNAAGAKSDLITPHAEYMSLGGTDSSRRAAYRRLFATEMAPGLITAIRQSTNGNYALGGERFSRRLANRLGRRVTPAQAGRPAGD